MLVLTIGIWMGLEVFKHGVSGAFGGDEAAVAQP